MKLLVNTDLHAYIAEMIDLFGRGSGSSCVHRSAKFGSAYVTDATVATTLQQEGGWTLLSGIDLSLRSSQAQIVGLKNMGVPAIVFDPAVRRLRYNYQALLFMNIWPTIEAYCNKLVSGQVLRLPATAKFKSEWSVI